jgi:hypothetical protein
MSPRILQINVKFSVSAAELKDAFTRLANDIAATPGLRWKVWIMNEAESEAGGIYLFDDADSVNAYLGGPIVAGLQAYEALTEISVKQFDVVEDLTAITRGPL